MHKLMHKGLKKKKKSKKSKKEAEEEEFNPEELERYRRERAEALEKVSIEADNHSGDSKAETTGSDEWKKFQALTASVDSILKKTQGDLDRIKSTSFFQRKIPVVEEKKPEEDPEVTKNKAKRWIGFDKQGNPIEQEPTNEDAESAKKKLPVNEAGFVEIPEDDDEEEYSAEEDIFDTTYVEVLQNIDVQLAYIPDSPVEDQEDDPFDTTNADKVLKTVDKHGKKVVSLGNAVEVLSGRIDHISTCKISRPVRGKVQDLLLGDFDSDEPSSSATPPAEPFKVEKTLLDDDDGVVDLQNLPIDLPPIIKPGTYVESNEKVDTNDINETVDISEFEILQEKKILEEIPDLDDDFDLNGPSEEPIKLEDAADPFAERESVEANIGGETIIEASFEVATFVNEEDPFDTTFAENIVPGKTELKFIEKELDELPESSVSVTLIDPTGLYRDYETGLLTNGSESIIEKNNDLLCGSNTDLTQLPDQPITPVGEITYTDPFDTSNIQQSAPGQTELKFLEKELLSNNNIENKDLEDDDFDPRKEEINCQSTEYVPIDNTNVGIENCIHENKSNDLNYIEKKRKPSRPEVLKVELVKSVAFELPTPSQRPDLLVTNDEEKSIVSKPLTPYYSQKSLEEVLPDLELDTVDSDPFDTSFVSKVTPGKTELKLIESELLKQETKLSHSTSEVNIYAKLEERLNLQRRQSDFGTGTSGPKSLKFHDFEKSLIEDCEVINGDSVESTDVLDQSKSQPKRQESILDVEVEVNIKTLTPNIESKVIQEEQEEEISYLDPFDTSIANNILPGKAELKQLENELSQIPINIQTIKAGNPIDLSKVSTGDIPVSSKNVDTYDSHSADVNESVDFLCLDDDISADKVLTPLHTNSLIDSESVDPFDTSFAIIEPGKTELKLLESELMNE